MRGRRPCSWTARPSGASDTARTRRGVGRTMIRDRVARKLSTYDGIAVWGAGSAAAQAIGQWLPRAKIVCLIETRSENLGSKRHGYEIRPPDAVDDPAVSCIVVCTDAYNEILETLAHRGCTKPVMHVFELLCSKGGEESELARLLIDIRVQKNRNWFDFLMDRPQVMVNLTYRLTRSCMDSAILFPAYVVLRILHMLTCVFFSISLPPTVKAGAGLAFQHFGSIVFHPRAELGRFVKVYQGSTIGANDVGDVPVIGNHVTIYHGAAVLGKCRIADHARIGAMALAIDLVSDRPCTIYGQPARVQRIFDTPKASTTAA